MMPLSMGTQGEEYEIQRIGGNDKTQDSMPEAR